MSPLKHTPSPSEKAPSVDAEVAPAAAEVEELDQGEVFKAAVGENAVQYRTTSWCVIHQRHSCSLD